MVYVQEISWTSEGGVFSEWLKLHSPEVSQSTCWPVHSHVHEHPRALHQLISCLHRQENIYSGFFLQIFPEKKKVTLNSDLNYSVTNSTTCLRFPQEIWIPWWWWWTPWWWAAAWVAWAAVAWVVSRLAVTAVTGEAWRRGGVAAVAKWPNGSVLIRRTVNRFFFLIEDWWILNIQSNIQPWDFSIWILSLNFFTFLEAEYLRLRLEMSHAPTKISQFHMEFSTGNF